jgi:tetratricopeptide (TPR) repeat protein
MNKLITTSLCLFLFLLSYSQEAKQYYDQGLELAQKGELDKALQLLDKSIALKSDEYVAWYNRAIVKSMMGRYEDALTDLEQTIKLNPGYKRAYLNRGTAKKHLTDYSGAMADYTLAMQLDSAYADAYYNRGLIYELFQKRDLACLDFSAALQFGYKSAQRKVDRCNDTMPSLVEIHPLLALSRQSDNFKYGLTSEYPVKVGTGPDGGLENERTYLGLLRDAKGNPVSYIHVSSCCGYKSPNAPKELAMEDKYEITYRNENDEEKKSFVFLSFYDYDEPKILPGFKTVGH